MDSLCFNRCHQLIIYEQGIVRISLVADSRICRPFSNRNISALCRTSALRIAQMLCISFPADLSQLFVNQISCLSFRFNSLTCSLTSLFFTIFFSNNRCRSCYFRCRSNQLFFLFLFGLFINNNRFGLFRWHYKCFALIVPVTISLHKPFSQAICHLNQCLAIIHRSIVLMDSFVPDLSECMKDIYQITGNHTFTEQSINTINGGIVIRQTNSVVSKDQVYYGFTNHSKLHQA